MSRVSDEILRVVEQLPLPLQQRVLDYSRRLLSTLEQMPEKPAPISLREFAEQFTPEEAEAFYKAIEEAFEQSPSD